MGQCGLPRSCRHGARREIDHLEFCPEAPQILNFDGWEVDGVQQLADAFVLPDLTDWQKQILTTAVAHIVRIA